MQLKVSLIIALKKVFALLASLSFWQMYTLRPMNMKKHIPNAVTLINAASGFLGIVEIFTTRDSYMISLWFGIGLLCDVLDGALARMLKVSSPLGVQLDSLADVISFGLFPSAMLYMIFAKDYPLLAPILCCICIMSCVLRLGRFNIKDDHVSGYFNGMPTPAFALLCYSLHLIKILEVGEAGTAPIWLMAVVLYMAFLLNSSFNFLNFKPKIMNRKTMTTRLLLLLSFVVIALWPSFFSLVFILLLYQVLSAIAYHTEYEIHSRN